MVDNRPTQGIDPHNWQPLTVAGMVEVMHGSDFPWWIAGGWAIDLFLGRQTRDHGDMDVLILRRDQLAAQAHLRDWLLYKTKQPGLAPWPGHEFLQPPVNDIWVRRDGRSPWAFQLLLMETAGDRWVYRRCATIGGAIAQLGCVDGSGVSYLAPQIQLLYKARTPLQPKDQADFELVIERLSGDRRDWLLKALQMQFPTGHEWIEHIGTAGQ